MTFQTEGDFEARTRDSFARQAMMATLGATLTRVAPGQVDLELPFAPELTQQHGFIHAGAVTSVLDSAAGYAAFTLMPEGAGVLTVELKVSLLRPAAGERFRFEGRVIKPGRNITFAEATGFALSAGAEVEIARLSATMMTMHGMESA